MVVLVVVLVLVVEVVVVCVIGIIVVDVVVTVVVDVVAVVVVDAVDLEVDDVDIVEAAEVVDGFDVEGSFTMDKSSSGISFSVISPAPVASAVAPVSLLTAPSFLAPSLQQLPK